VIDTPLAIETQHLSRFYGASRAVDRLSLAVPQGSLFGLLGLKGAGKTTTLRMLLGQVSPSQGSIQIFGHDLQRERAAALAPIGSVSASPAFYQLFSARDNLRILARGNPARQACVDKALDLVGLAAVKGRRVRTLSPGMQRHLALASALIGRPELLLLDEPTADLTPAEAQRLHGLIRHLVALGLTVLVATASLREVEQLCTAAALLNQGRLVTQGQLRDLLARRESLLVVAEPLPLVAAMADAFGFPHAPAGSHAVRIEAPAELGPRIHEALLGAGASVAQVTAERRGLADLYGELGGPQAPSG
jgi:ABC-2 type transport system ATP-binding protein